MPTTFDKWYKYLLIELNYRPGLNLLLEAAQHNYDFRHFSQLFPIFSSKFGLQVCPEPMTFEEST